MYANNPEMFLGKFEAKATQGKSSTCVFYFPPAQGQSVPAETHLHPCLTFAAITDGRYDVPPPRTFPTPDRPAILSAHFCSPSGFGP